jgi:integrase
MILRECRALGLIRPGQPMSGLPDDFAVRRDDIPQQASDDEPGRALPVSVLNQLIAALPLLEQSASPALRAAVELLMDTGRRPTEVCKLGWDWSQRRSRPGSRRPAARPPARLDPRCAPRACLPAPTALDRHRRRAAAAPSDADPQLRRLRSR